MENQNATPQKRKLNQAERIIKIFGNARKLAKILLFLGKGRHPTSIYRWTRPRTDGGTDGIIPTSAWPDILAAARLEGLVIPKELYDPALFIPKGKYVGDDTFHDKRKKYARRGDTGAAEDLFGDLKTRVDSLKGGK